MKPLTFGSQLRRYRRDADLTLADLARVLHCSVVYVSMIERGEKSPPSAESIAKLMRKLGRPERTDDMILLAIKSRKAVEISMLNKAEEEQELLAALARKSDAGEISAELASELLKLLVRSRRLVLFGAKIHEDQR